MGQLRDYVLPRCQIPVIYVMALPRGWERRPDTWVSERGTAWNKLRVDSWPEVSGFWHAPESAVAGVQETLGGICVNLRTPLKIPPFFFANPPLKFRKFRLFASCS